MAIVCGTDFSLNSGRAVRAAAALALRLGEPLVLLHVVDWTRTELLGVTALDATPARERLRRIADRVRRHGVEVAEEIGSGVPDEVLVERAARVSARLLVVASLGRRGPARWLLGSVAERTAQTSPVPVLVVRRSSAFRRWVRDGAPLRLVVGVDFSPAGDAALAAARELWRAGPCEVVVAHVRAAAAERPGSAVPGAAPTPSDDGLLRELTERAGTPPREGRLRIRVAPSSGPVSGELVRLAVEEAADVLVVGTHQRTGTSRLWHGSVSNAILHLAPSSVLCAPATERRDARAIPRLRTVVVAADVADLAAPAVLHAHALLPAGGAVHLVHVVAPPAAPLTAGQRASRDRELLDRLRTLVPAGAEARGIETRCEIVEQDDAAEAICAAADRFGADLICLGRRGDPARPGAPADSLPGRVMRRTTRPVLVVGGGVPGE